MLGCVSLAKIEAFVGQSILVRNILTSLLNPKIIGFLKSKKLQPFGLSNCEQISTPLFRRTSKVDIRESEPKGINAGGSAH